MPRFLAMVLVFAVTCSVMGCGSSKNTDNPGVPIQLNQDKNAPKGYGPPGESPTGPPKGK